MAGANRDMKRGVERLPIMGDGWKGVSGDAAHHEIDRHNKYLEGHAEAQEGAARRIRLAADEFEGVQQLLKKIESDAAKGKFSINYDTGEVTPPSGKYDKNELDYLKNTLRQIQAAGDRANADLEAAVKAAKTLPDPSGTAAQALPSTPDSAVKPSGSLGALQNLAAPTPDGDPGATKAAAATGTDTQANYKEWYPKTPGGDKSVDPSKLGSIGGTIEHVNKNGTPLPPAKPGFGEGVARKFGDGVNSRIDGVIDEAKNLTGQGGPGSPGVAESWAKFVLGTADQMANPLGSLPGEVKDAVNDPAGFAGKKLFDVSSVAATGPLGGEAAAGARGLLGDLTGAETRGLTHGLPGPHEPPPAVHGPVEPPGSGGHSGGGGGLSGDHAGGIGDAGGGPGGHGMPGGNPTPFDFDNPIETARPEFNIPNPLEVMSPELRSLVDQHLTGSGETVIGPYAPKGGGPSYIDVAQQRGASYFDIGDAWNSSTPTQQLASNQYALDMAVKNGDTIRMSVPFYRIDPSTFTGAEIRYFESHGYQRVGDNLLIPPPGGRP